MLSFRFQKLTLKNKARIILVPMPSTEAVTLLVLVGVGSRYETPVLNGASHFIEHMMFKGTTKRPTTLDISRELDRVGAVYNAYTAKDHTGYWITIPAKHFDLAVDILFDMLFHSKFENEEIERERKVILEEIKMYKENPLMHIDELFDALIFMNHPLGWSIAGTEKTMIGIDRQKLLDFKEQFYQPRNMVVVAAGKIEKKTQEKIKEYLEEKPDASITKKASPFQFKKGKPVSLFEQKVDQAQLALGFPSYSYFHPRLPALKLLNVILGGNMSSRLFIEVRERRGLAYFIRSEIETFSDTGSFKIRAGLDVNRIEEAIKIILNELKRIKEGATAKELEDAKECIRGRLILSLEDSAEQAEWCGKQEILLNEIKTPRQRLAEIEQVTVEELKFVANEIIKSNRLRCALIGPWKDEDKFVKLLKSNEL
jgi:predicted Zn-dependent peptidase